MKKLRKIIGFRFNSIEKIKEKLIELGFEEVHAFEHISKMSATNNKKNTIERLFWNGKGEANKHTLF